MYPYIHILGRDIGTYGLMLALAVCLAALLAILSAKKFDIVPEDIFIVGAFAIALAVVCGNLLYIVISYPFSYIVESVKSGDFSFITNGGLVFYGSLIGGLAGAFLGCRVAKCRVYGLERAVIPFLPLAHAIGRIGCFLAGCCYGFEYDGKFSVHYPRSVAGALPTQGYFPTQLVESGINILIFLLLLRYRNKVKKPFDMISAYLLLYSVSRFFLEFLRGDSHRGIYFALSTSQWISLVLLIASAFHFIISRKRRIG